MPRPRVAFWYEFASTYSYPAAMRIEAMAEAAGVEVAWKPFLLGPIFARQGWNDSPFNLYPAKGAYMWRDLARICASEGLALALPPMRFPQNGLKAARLALAGEKEGWIAPFTRAVYRANFAEQKDISDDATLAAILERIGVGVDAAVAAANSAGIKQRLGAQTEEAIALGVFGAPSFSVGEELFWGNDRLEQALGCACDPANVLARELADTDPALVARMQPWLFDSPKLTQRRFETGGPASDSQLCWLVLEHPQSGTAIAYAPKGFGPRAQPEATQFSSLADAFRRVTRR